MGAEVAVGGGRRRERMNVNLKEKKSICFLEEKISCKLMGRGNVSRNR